eukprot:scaffold2263_cov59-Attheya_sp.AAC.1
MSKFARQVYFGKSQRCFLRWDVSLSWNGRQRFHLKDSQIFATFVACDVGLISGLIGTYRLRGGREIWGCSEWYTVPAQLATTSTVDIMDPLFILMSPAYEPGTNSLFTSSVEDCFSFISG